MAAPVQQTSGGGEGQKSQNEDSVDYVALLRTSLQEKKLLYIADLVMELEELDLSQLLKWERPDLIEILRDIHNDNNHDHKIKVVHRNKFADTIIRVATQQQEALQKQLVAPSASTTGTSQVKLLFLGKDEEEAIEVIQSGQKCMDQYLVKMQQLYTNLDENNKNIKQKLETICTSLKQQIDDKQKQMISTIDGIYQYKLSALKARSEVAQQSAKVVAKFYNDYESYFHDDKLTKSERRDKLVAAKESIAIEVDRINKHEEIAYNMDIALDKGVVDECLSHFLSLKDICIDLPVVETPEVDENDGTTIQWKTPQFDDDLKVLFKGASDEPGDNKEEDQLAIEYQILYKKEEQDEEKKGDEWNRITILGRENQYDMKDYAPCTVALQYRVNNILQSLISKQVQILEVQYIAVWSPQHNSSKITLSEENTKAYLNSGDGAVRAVHPIKKGMVVTLDYVRGGGDKSLDIIGLVSSEATGYVDARGPYAAPNMVKHCYGADCYYYSDSSNKHYYGEYKDLGWTLGDKTKQSEITIRMIVDYKTCDTCCLSFYIDGQFKGPQNSKYSMKLPKLDNGHDWYPITSFWRVLRRQGWCKIVCVQ
eukprot:269401_1